MHLVYDANGTLIRINGKFPADWLESPAAHVAEALRELKIPATIEEVPMRYATSRSPNKSIAGLMLALSFLEAGADWMVCRAGAFPKLPGAPRGDEQFLAAIILQSARLISNAGLASP